MFRLIELVIKSRIKESDKLAMEVVQIGKFVVPDGATKA